MHREAVHPLKITLRGYSDEETCHVCDAGAHLCVFSGLVSKDLQADVVIQLFTCRLHV